MTVYSAKTFHRVFTAVDHIPIAITLWQQNILYHAIFIIDVHWNAPPWNWQMLVASKAVFLENYLAVSTWILNGPSIECLEKKYQPFSLAGVRFGSLVNQISGLKSAWRRSGLCLTLLLCNCCYKWILRNNPRNQTDIFRLNVTLTTPRSQSCIINSFLQG